MLGQGSFGRTFLAHEVQCDSEELSEFAVKVAEVHGSMRANYTLSEAIAMPELSHSQLGKGDAGQRVHIR